MSGYTRLTIQGGQRKTDVVVPDDEPIASIVPELVALLEEDRGDGARPVVLATLLGDQLEPSRTLDELGVRQGALLRLVRIDQAPPPPEVADVTDLAADAVTERGDRWRPTWSVVAASLAAALAGWIAARPAVDGLGIAPASLVLVTAALVLVATALARTRQVRAAVPLAAAGAGLALALAPALAAELGGTPAGAFVVGVALLCVPAGATALAVGRRDVALGAATGLVLAGIWLLLARLSPDPSTPAAVLVVLGTFALGLLPGVAMTVSGLNGLDDRVVAGDRPGRSLVARAVDTTHRALTWATLVAAALITAAGTELARAGGPPAWSLTAAVAVVLALRARVLPLAPGRLALLAASTGITGALLLAVGQVAPTTALGLLGGGALLLVVAAGAPLSGHLQARARRFADIVELIAVVAIVPLLLVQLGVLHDLLGTF